LRIRLYVLRHFDDKTTAYGDKEDYGQHERIRKLYGRPDLEKLIRSEVERRRGRLLISSRWLTAKVGSHTDSAQPQPSQICKTKFKSSRTGTLIKM